MNKIRNCYFGEDVRLEKRIYYACSAMVVLNSVILYSFNAAVSLGGKAAITSAFAVIVMITVTMFGCISKNYKIWAFINVIALNLIMQPIAFFSYGGMKSGMLSYLIMGIFICAVTLRGKMRRIAGALSVAADAVILTLSFVKPEMVTEKEPFHHFITLLLCLSVAGGLIYIISFTIMDQFVTQRMKYEALLSNLKRLSNEEPLTGLYNRRYLIGKAENELESREDVCAVMIDIDDFKEHNTLHGHQYGDEILIKIASLIAEIFGYENVCRYGGEEFLAILNGVDISAVGNMAETLRSRMKTMDYGREDSEVTVSVGIARKGGRTIYETISAADKMLYEAKNHGKNKIKHMAC
ncbi:MAG: GGDEF domain-containing protein [Eubacteriales bacterium]|nr:GGDEF domain-containing protein [Eubacteriales bacterium]